MNSVTNFFRIANILIEVNHIYLDTLQDTLPKIEKVGLLSYSSPLENMFSSLRTSVDIVWHVSVQFLKFTILSSTHTNHFTKLWWFLGILIVRIKLELWRMNWVCCNTCTCCSLCHFRQLCSSFLILILMKHKANSVEFAVVQSSYPSIALSIVARSCCKQCWVAHGDDNGLQKPVFHALW